MTSHQNEKSNSNAASSCSEAVKAVRVKAERWSALMASVRKFLRQRSCLEVSTPSLVICPGTEPSLDVFTTSLEFSGKAVRQLHLVTSPELHLKKALAMGLENVFEIKSCYRNGEITEHHQPEFTMLEFYRLGLTWRQLASEVLELIHFCHEELGLSSKFGIAKASSEMFSVADLFLKYTAAKITPQWGASEYLDLAMRLNLHVPKDAGVDDLFFLIWLQKIETQLDPSKIIFVHSYPPFQAALAEIGSDGWAQRFEVYWKGLELGNAFQELRDPVIQKQRALEDLAKKKARGGRVTELDPEFFELLSQMPPCSGIAMGIERLTMALFDLQNIADVRLWTMSR